VIDDNTIKGYIRIYEKVLNSRRYGKLPLNVCIVLSKVKQQCIYLGSGTQELPLYPRIRGMQKVMKRHRAHKTNERTTIIILT
jgi:hypothetical protein